jgi:hypothetical protein
MQQNDESGSPVTWGEHVTDEQYGAAGRRSNRVDPRHPIAMRAEERSAAWSAYAGSPARARASTISDA